MANAENIANGSDVAVRPQAADAAMTRRSAVAAIAMGSAALASKGFHPSLMSSEQLPPKLSASVPMSFASWSTAPAQSGVIVNPYAQSIIEEIYADTLERTYVDGQGAPVMMSLSYGRNQNRELQVHKPEVCYVAQGFQLLSSVKTELKLGVYTVPVLQLVTQLGPRVEPVTYWIRVGDRIIRGWLEQNLARLSLGLKGVTADGLLVRVSTIGTDVGTGFARQQQFLADMLRAIPASATRDFLGQS